MTTIPYQVLFFLGSCLTNSYDQMVAQVDAALDANNLRALSRYVEQAWKVPTLEAG